MNGYFTLPAEPEEHLNKSARHAIHCEELRSQTLSRAFHIARRRGCLKGLNLGQACALTINQLNSMIKESNK